MSVPINAITITNKLCKFLLDEKVYTEFMVMVSLHRHGTIYPIAHIGHGFALCYSNRPKYWSNLGRKFNKEQQCRQ